MIGFLRRLGGLGLLLILILLAADAWRRLRPHAIGVEIDAPGFRQDLPGLGSIETSFTGSVLLRTERRKTLPDGSVRRILEMDIAGHDPRPERRAAPGEPQRMLLQDARITSYAEDGQTPLFTVVAPQAHLPLAAGEGGVQLDRDHAWLLDTPRLSLPAGGPAAGSRLEVAHAALNPRSRMLTGQGPFTLHSGPLMVQGRGIVHDPLTREFHFGTEGGGLRWELQIPGGETLLGRSDLPGVLRSDANGGGHLDLPARRACELELPPGSGLPGHFQCAGFHADFAGAAKTSLEGVRAQAPVEWHGFLPDGTEAALWGGAARLLFDATGGFEGIALQGPLRILSGGEDPAWAVVHGGAWVGNGPGQPLDLYGGIEGMRAGQVFHARLASHDLTGWRLHGDLAADGGRLVAEDADFIESRRLLDLRGGALVALDGRSGIAAPHIFHDPLVGLTAFDGATLRTTLDGLPGRVSGHDMSLRGDPSRPESLVLVAEREVSLERAGVLLQGDWVRILGNQRVELVGVPARGFFPTDQGDAELDAARLVWDGTTLLPIGAPALRFPGALFGLAGGEVRAGAQIMHFRPAERSWLLRGTVHFEGALQCEAGEIRGSPEDIVLERAGTGVVSVSGRFEERSDHLSRFLVSAERMRLDADRRLYLTGRAHLALEATDGRRLVFDGASAELSEASGSFSGKARAHSEGPDGPLDGSARRIVWRIGPQGITEVRFEEGNPHLQGSGIEADGRRLIFLPLERVLTAIGSVDRPARISREGDLGGRASGEWLRLDLVQRLLSGARGRLEKP